ncbi:MAG: ATP-binding cassette domain-containing protein [Clostridiaceae bacterium]|nr:ATP-binding cassette domain-containing protein [Clostridiaceae bacterium]
MACFEIRHLTFRYPGESAPAIDDLSLTLGSGEFITLCGPSGCGKTTLLRSLKPALALAGQVRGDILFDSRPLSALDARSQAASIGFVQQNPDNQLVTDKVWHELAFGLESLGMKTPEIRRRVAEMASFFGIEDWYYRDVSSLSGGQKQLLNLAAVMAMQPRVLLLDEPTSQLDPIAASDFLSTVARLNRELGIAVLITEHRLEEVFPFSDRVAVMEGGRLLCADKPSAVGTYLTARNHAMFTAMPSAMRVWAAVPHDAADRESPVTVSEGRAWLASRLSSHPALPIPAARPSLRLSDTPSVELSGLWFRYEKTAPDVLRDLSLRAYPGELYAILGGNGAGKSTALSVAAGIRRPYRGLVKILGRDPAALRSLGEDGLALLPQNPQSLFVGKTVREDLYAMLDEQKLPQAQKKARVDEVLLLCRITAFASRHPYDLSGGEQQRAALAKVLLKRPRVLLLDEPTKGLDAEFKRILASILRRLADTGVTLVMISHDVEFCAAYADRCGLLFDGCIVAEDRPRAFFAGLSFYTTSSNRMARGLIPDAVTPDDLILACGGTPPPLPQMPDEPTRPSSAADTVPSGASSTLPRKRAFSVRSGITLAAAFAVMLTTLLAGIYLFGDRRYYIVSILLLAESILPFYVLFERRKPQARELVLLAALSAIGVAGRAAFFMLPSFKPVLAIVILAGIALGGESGFLVGATTAFVSNFFFGQGPWTPWQMFAYGIAGLLSGLLRERGLLSEKRLPLTVYGVLSALILYGGVMNPASVLMYQSHPTLAMFGAAYLAGLPVDLVHAGATACFLWFFSQPFLEKLERIRIKYGLIPLSVSRKES